MITQDIQVDLKDFFAIMDETIRSVQVTLKTGVTHIVVYPSNDKRKLKKNIVCEVLNVKANTAHFKKRLTRS